MEAKTAITEKVKGYYLKGLNYKEIGKFLDISPLTVQCYAKESGCRQRSDPKTLQQRAVELHLHGWSYTEIAKKLKISRTTAYMWNKKAKHKIRLNSEVE